MSDNRNTSLAVILSGLVLIAWQYFYNVPQKEKRKLAEQTQSELVKPTQPGDNPATPGAAPAKRFAGVVPDGAHRGADGASSYRRAAVGRRDPGGARGASRREPPGHAAPRSPR